MAAGICLSIEATTHYLGMGVYRFSGAKLTETLREFFEKPDGKQSEVLIPRLDSMLKRARVKREDLSLIAVNVGPGSFTGVRVGLAAARTLAQGLEIPLAGVNGLAAMAFGTAEESPDAIVVPVLPAVAGEVYFASYRGSKELRKPVWTEEKKLKEYLLKHPGAVIARDPAQPKEIAALGVRRFQKEPRFHFHYEQTQPLYLQPSWAERSKRSV